MEYFLALNPSSYALIATILSLTAAGAVLYGVNKGVEAVRVRRSDRRDAARAAEQKYADELAARIAGMEPKWQAWAFDSAVAQGYLSPTWRGFYRSPEDFAFLVGLELILAEPRPM